jgi:EAL domain-containing protein (putative c-di-GMP-specific phosphodiesterase class I)/GGDEF domain-containing protein
VAGVLFLLSAVLWIPILIANPTVPLADPPWYLPAALAVAFVLCELYPLRVEVRRETLMVSLSELPLVIGVLLLPPWMVGAVYLTSGLAVYLVRRDNWRNDLMNLALIAVETGAAVFVVSVLGGEGTDLAARYLPVVAGVLCGALISALAVGVAYRLMGSGESLVTVVTRSMLTAATIVGFALVGVTVWTSAGWGPVLCLGLAIVLGILYRTYSTFLREHADLTRMYAFGRDVTAVGTDFGEWPHLIEQIRDQLNASVAVLQLASSAEGPTTLAIGPDGPVEAPMPPENDQILINASATGGTRASTDRTSDRRVLQSLAARDAWDVMVVPLRSGDHDSGYLEVRDRRSRWGRFSDDDLQLLSTLGGHLATALDNNRLVERLRHEAYHDSITGLCNRLGLRMASADLEQTGSFGGVLVVQLNVLGEVNSALGHDRGEQLLAAAGARLVSAAPGLTIGRIEADRFAILLGPEDEDSAAATADRIITAVCRPYSVDGIDVEPHATAGVALRSAAGPTTGVGPGPGDGSDRESLLQRAEMALLAARVKGEQLAIYQSTMGEVYRRRFQLVTQFRRAVETGRIILHYQPKLNLAERELAGAEALVRWVHPEFGLVSPAEFVEAIEATGSIDILFAHVLDTALAQVADWLSRGMRIGIAVNLSVRNLLAESCTETVSSALKRYGVPPHLLTLEITESSVMAQPEFSLPVLRNLHALGIRLAVDDFGTGYSSLAYLSRLPIDEIKIDKSFVQGMVTDLSDSAIVQAIVDLGHSLGLAVIAEGVEEEAARDLLREMSCDGIQGYLLSRPLPIDRFDAWLATRTTRVTDPGALSDSVPLRVLS